MTNIGTLGLATEPHQRQVLHCGNCNEIVNTSMERCPFCSSPVDIEAAKAQEDALAQVVQASTSVGYVKLIAYALVGSYLVSWIPVIGAVGHWGTLLLLFVVPAAVMLWWVQHQSVSAASLKSRFASDPDVSSPFWDAIDNSKRARRSAVSALVIWVFMLTVWLVVPVVYVAVQLSNLSANSIVAFESTDDTYWVLPVSSIARHSLNTITIKKGTPAAKCVGRGCVEVVAQDMESMSRVMRGQIYILDSGIAKSDIDVEVVKVVGSKTITK